MANITQTIPNLTQGISQQPDEYKIPGQVKDMVNTLPDVTQGLQKRPAGKFVGSLSDGSKNSSTDGRWFHYYRDENEQYIGQVHKDGTVRMWDCLTGAEKNVVDVTTSGSITYADGTTGNKYLKHTADEHIQTLSLNDFTYLTNRNVNTAMDSTIEPVRPPEAFVELKTVAYAKQYSLNLFDQDGSQSSHFTTLKTATRVSIEAVGQGYDPILPNVGTKIFNIQGLPAVYQIDFSNLRDDLGTEWYDITDGTTEIQVAVNLDPDSAQPNWMCTERLANAFREHKDYDKLKFTIGTESEKQANHYHINYGTTFRLAYKDGGTQTLSGVKVRRTNVDQSIVHATFNATQVVEGKNATGTNSNGKSNLYFRIRTTGQAVPHIDYNPPEYYGRYQTTIDLLYGGEGYVAGDTLEVGFKHHSIKITIDEISESKVQANLGLIRPSPTSFDTKTTVTSESIIGAIRTDILATGNFTDANVKIIGTGLYITRASGSFNISTGVEELLGVTAGKVDDIGDLPSQCKHGMVIEVINSAADEDNHYVKFFGNNDRDGEGVWEECAKPGRKVRFDRHSMPVALIRTADGNFRLAELDDATYTINSVDYNHPVWDDALVGSDITNPEPSFIGNPITKLMFFRNRLALLSNENIILSRPGKFFNFFSTSAIQFIASDPIDISASSEYPAILYDGIPVNTGLVLFTKNQQFMLTTDSDVLSIQTAKINSISNYNFNSTTNPISLGTTIGFLDNAGKYSRFFEMAGVLREGEPQVIEQSAVVSRLFNKDLRLISNSRENSVIFFSEEDSSTLYGYRYFDQINNRKLASWFKWTVTGTIQYHCVQDDALYVVVRNNNKDQLLKYSLKMDANTFTIDSTNRVHLDHLMSTSGWSYNATTKKSTKAKPTGLESTNQLAAYDVDTANNNLGRYAKITINGSNLELDGDWSGETFLIGYLFTMQVDFPTIYYKKQSGESWSSDIRSNTIIHRVKLGFGPVGIYESTLARKGKTDYTELFEVTPADNYSANTSGIFDDNIIRTVPVYDRNTNTTLTLKSTHPAPATLHNMTWEGVYTTNNYSRV